MKMMNFLAAAAGVLCAVSLFAQEGRQERPAFPEPVSDSAWVVTRTREMVEKYALAPEQEAKIQELNQQYASKLNFSGMAPHRGERKDIRSMSDEERMAFFQEMQERMGEMQERMQEMQKARKDYEEALKEILDKDQFKAYRKDRRRQEAEMQKRMQQGMGGRPGGMGPGGMGPGGFPGGGPGGFPGGGPGGFGGF